MSFEKHTLTTTEREKIAAHIEQCLDVFTEKHALLTAVELQLKAMLATVYRQLKPRERPTAEVNSPTPKPK